MGIEDGGSSPEVEMTLHISQLVYTIVMKFSRLYPCFGVRQHDSTTSKTARRVDLLGIKDQRWRHITGSRSGITYLPTCIHDSNKTPTYIGLLMFSGLGNKAVE